MGKQAQALQNKTSVAKNRFDALRSGGDLYRGFGIEALTHQDARVGVPHLDE